MSASETRRNWVKPIFGLIISGVFLYLLLHGLNFTKIRTTFSGISIPSVMYSLLMLAFGYLFRIIRWWLMMRFLNTSITVRDCARPFLASIAANNVLPFRAGDMLRIFGFRGELNVPAMRILATMLVERLLDLMVLLGVFFACLLHVPQGGFPAVFVTTAKWGAALGAFSVLTLMLCSKRLLAIVHALLGRDMFNKFRFTDGLLKQVEHFLHTFDILATWRLISQLIVLSILVWGFEGAVFVMLAYGLDTGTSILADYFSMATGTLATLLPSSPGYIGTFDYFTSYGLEVFGARREQATVYALAVHVILWLPLTLIGALLYYFHPGLRLRDEKRMEKSRY